MLNLKRTALTLGCVVLSTWLLAGPASAAQPLSRLPRLSHVFAHIPPPPPLHELRAPMPGRHRVWVPGHYIWNGRAYYWRGGEWVRPPRAGLRWLPGRWHHDRRGWYWTNGRWR